MGRSYCSQSREVRIPAWARTERVVGNDKRKESDGIPKLLAPLFALHIKHSSSTCGLSKRQRERKQTGNRASCT